MNRVCIVLGKDGLERVISDEPVRCFTISEHAPNDRVYELTPGVGVLEFGSERVQSLLRDDPVGRYGDRLEPEGRG